MPGFDTPQGRLTGISTSFGGSATDGGLHQPQAGSQDFQWCRVFIPEVGGIFCFPAIFPDGNRHELPLLGIGHG